MKGEVVDEIQKSFLADGDIPLEMPTRKNACLEHPLPFKTKTRQTHPNQTRTLSSEGLAAKGGSSLPSRGNHVTTSDGGKSLSPC
mmetsp:Transcript_6836/g.15764  ORF Transcript_6836/g.15764 Transcript_6836/m.15764 type:complete len:85 (+) Transcript_6836:418-672(+)